MVIRGLKGCEEVIDEDFPDLKISDRTVQRAREYQGQVRKPYELQEYESWRKRVLNEPLP